MHVTIRSVAGHAAATVPPADEVSIGKVGMSSGFCHIVLRLVESDSRAKRSLLHGRSPDRITPA